MTIKTPAPGEGGEKIEGIPVALRASQPDSPNPLLAGGWTAHQGWADKWIDPSIDTKHPNWCEITGPADGPYLSISGHFGIEIARVLAASPELLKAARCALGVFTGNMDGNWDLGDPVAMLRAALARAEGGS